MYCKHCGSIQPDNAPYCNRCGKPISDNSADENRKKNIVGGILAVIAACCLIPVFIIIAGGGLNDTSSSQATTATTIPEKQIIKITAEELYQAYENNEVAADRKYGGQLVEITGTVDNIGADILDRVYITFSTSKVLYSVQCYFEDEEAIDGVANISKGQNITIVGTCDGFSLNVSVKDCTITDFAPAESSTQTSSLSDENESK